MLHHLILVAALLLTITAHAADVCFQADFDTGKAPGWDGPGLFEDAPGRGKVLHITQSAPAGQQRSVLTIPLPIETMRGNFVFFGADVRAKAISAKPLSWTGVKVMLIVETPAGKQYPQAEIPVGDIDWTRYSFSAPVPHDATAVSLVLGLEHVSGDAWFDNPRVALRKKITQTPAADPDKPIYRGHNLPRLRGAQVSNALGQADFVELADKWNVNIVRWQLTRPGRTSPTIESFDAWFANELIKLDQTLIWAEAHGVKIVVDLHSPPGGEGIQGGYVAAIGRIFSVPEAQQKFIQAWQAMAQRYKGREVIWGFDIMNEPDDKSLAEGCDDWQDLAIKTAKAIHAIDPQRTLIIEPTPWGDPGGFRDFQPLDEPNVVYSFHMYLPHSITHQGVFEPTPGLTYPGTVNGKLWDKAALEAAMQPAIDFANRYRVHMYVGEFSCVRTAPGDTQINYLTDVIDLFEKHAWDWSYHSFREWEGWSLEHTGPLDQPALATEPGPAQKLMMGWYGRNQKP